MLLLKWKQKDKVPEPLEYKVKLLGTGDENDFFVMVHHPGVYMYKVEITTKMSCIDLE